MSMITDYVHTLRGFNRDVRLYLFTAALLGFTAFGGIYPVLFNLYLLRLEYGPDFVGLINSVGGLAFAVFSLPAGMLSARWGGRRTMIAGLSIAILAFAVLPLGEFLPPTLRSPWLLGSYLTRAIGFALYWVNARPFLMSATRAEERSHVYSIQSAIFPLTGFAGSLIAGLLPGLFASLLNVSLAHPAPFRYPLWSVALLLLPGLVALGTIGEFDTGQRRRSEAQGGNIPLATIGLLSLALMLQAAGQGATMSFYNVYLDNSLHMSTQVVGAISAVSQLLSTLASLSVPLLAKRWGNSRIFIWGSLGAALCLLPLALVPHWAAAAASYLGAMALYSVAFPAMNLYQMELVAPQWRTAMSGTTAMANGLSFSATSFAGGHAIQTWGYRPFFLAGAALTLVGALLFRVSFGTGDRKTPNN
ncbi:MAG: MFS transporter [Anaerolineae bacterium]|nr:MFS transporter [Anaerolineae bacterium]